MNALKYYNHLFLSFQWTVETSGKYRVGYPTSGSKREPRPYPIQRTFDSHSTKFHIAGPEAEVAVANNTFRVVSLFVVPVSRMCHSRN